MSAVAGAIHRIRVRGSIRQAPQGGREPVLPPNPHWMDDAACAGTDDPVFFIPGEGETKAAIDAGQRFCNRCPVRVACLAYALKTSSPGIWAGTTTEHRRKLSRKRSRVKCPVCSCATLITEGGHDICTACAVSWRVEDRPELEPSELHGNDDD